MGELVVVEVGDQRLHAGALFGHRADLSVELLDGGGGPRVLCGPGCQSNLLPRCTDCALAGVGRLADRSLHPTGPGRIRLTAGQFLNSPADPEAAPTLDELQAWLGPVTGQDLTTGAEPVWFDRWFYVTRQAVQYRSGRVFVAGDAAHVHFPLGGQAVSTGVEDAVNLGWKLAATLHGWAPEGLLDTYHAERHPVGARALLTTHAQAALLHPIGGVDGARAILSDLIKIPEVNAYFVRLAGGTDVHYGAAEGAHPLTGSRAVNATLVTGEGETEVATALRAARGVLLDLSAEPGGYAATAAGWSDRVDTVAAKPTAEIDASAVLLRPDGRVAWAAGADADPSGLDAALRAWFGAPTAA